MDIINAHTCSIQGAVAVQISAGELLLAQQHRGQQNVRDTLDYLFQRDVLPRILLLGLLLGLALRLALCLFGLGLLFLLQALLAALGRPHSAPLAGPLTRGALTAQTYTL